MSYASELERAVLMNNLRNGIVSRQRQLDALEAEVRHLWMSLEILEAQLSPDTEAAKRLRDATPQKEDKP